MDNNENGAGRVDRVSPSQSMASPVYIEPPEPDAEVSELPQVGDGADSEAAPARAGLFGRLKKSAADDGKRVETQTSIDRVREMVIAGGLKQRMVNISVFFLMAILGLVLIAKIMSPAALEGGMKESRDVVNGVMQK